MYGHDGRRGASNWKGSASYFHIRDSVPVYYWPDNHGAYTLYATAKHFIERKFFPKKYMADIASNPNWNKLRLNFKNFIKEPSTSWLFAKNQFYAMQDVGLHIKGKEVQIVYRLFLVNCYILHVPIVPRVPSQSASNVGG